MWLATYMRSLRSRTIAVLQQGLADPALGEFILTGDALGVRAKEHVHAVACVLRDRGRRHPAVKPCGQARVPQVVGQAISFDSAELGRDHRLDIAATRLNLGPHWQDRLAPTGANGS